MATSLSVGSRVKVKATHFDVDERHLWSKETYGRGWRTAYCTGRVKSMRKTSKFCIVSWDDGDEGDSTRVPVSLIEQEHGDDSANQPDTSSSSVSEGIEEPGSSTESELADSSSSSSDSSATESSEESADEEEPSSSQHRG